MAHAKVKGWFHPEPAPAAPQVGARPARLQAVRPAALPTTRRPVYSGLPDAGGSELPATAADLEDLQGGAEKDAEFEVVE